jgi:hypothetical protein
LTTEAENIIEKLLLDDKRELFEGLLAIDKAIPKTIESILFEIESYDPNLFRVWENYGIKDKIATYLLHYVLPFGELLKESNTGQTSKLLAVELLSFISWRTFDNCVDGHEDIKMSHLGSLASCMKFVGFVQTHFPNAIVEDIYEYYKVMAEQALKESEQAIVLDDIWKRCAIIFYAPNALAKLHKNRVEIFKSFINYTGLAHDMTDIANDISNGIISLPVYWLRGDGITPTINRLSIMQLYTKVQDELKPIEEKFAFEQVEKKFPLMKFLIENAKKVLYDH